MLCHVDGMSLKVATELILPECELGWRFSYEPGPGRRPSVQKASAMGETSTEPQYGAGPPAKDPDPATHTTEQATTAPGRVRGQCQRDPRKVNVHTLKQKPL
jgi:hypothetical protein